MKKWLFYIMHTATFTSAIGQGTGYVSLEGKQFKDENGNDFYPLCMNYGLDLIYDSGSSSYYFSPLVHYGPERDFECNDLSSCQLIIQNDLQVIRDLGFNTVHIWGCTPYADETNFGFFVKTWENTHPWWNINPPVKYYFPMPFSVADPVIQTMLQLYVDICAYANTIGLKVIIDGQMGDGLGFANASDYYADFLEIFGTKMNAATTPQSAKSAFMAYVLMGEPYYDSDQTNFTKQEVCERTALWYNTLKTVDPNHLVCSGGIDFLEVKEHDPGVVKMDFYFPHFYPNRVNYEDLGIGIPNYNATMDRVKATIWWLGQNSPMPWMIGETGFSATDITPIIEDKLNGTLSEQQTYFEDALEWVRNCGGSGFSAWQFQEVWWDDGGFQDGLGLLRHGDTQDPLAMPNLKKPGLIPFSTYLTNGQPPVIQTASQPANYYDPFHHETFNSNKINAVSGNIVDQAGNQINDAVIEALNWLNTDDKGNSDPIDDEYIHSWIYTFSNSNNQPTNFEVIPYSPFHPIDPKIVYIRGSAVGASRFEDGQPYPWTDIQMQTAVGNKTLNRINFNYDTYVNNLTISPNSVQQSFRGWNKFSASNLFIENGSVSDLTARNEINMQLEFHAKTGSEVHIFPSEVFPVCADYSGFLRMVDNSLTSVGNNEDSYQIGLEFDQKIDNIQDALIVPNPNNGSFTVRLTNNENNELLRIIIRSTLGNELKQFVFNGVEIRIDLQNSVCGLYFVEIHTIRKIITKKLIIN